MPNKTKKAVTAVRKTITKASAKAKPAVGKAAAKVRTAVKPLARKAAGKSKAGKKEGTGFIQQVKDGVHSAMESVGDFVKKITPDPLLPKAARSKRK